MSLLQKCILVIGSIALLVALYHNASGWGWDSHRFINRKAVYHLPNQMTLFIQDSSYFADHSIDADQRRDPADTSLYGETPRHFLDIDDYPNFTTVSHDLDSLIAQFGWERVKQNGTNPWATVWNLDSLVDQLARGDWAAAKLTASDIGHYVGDAHQPLHCTRNYNGQYTNNFGIHSRYETTMLSASYYLSSLYVVPDTVVYIADPIEYTFDYIIHSNSLIDTILQGDGYAKAVSGWNGSGNAPPAYYAALWDRTRAITLDQMQRGTQAIANLWYSAWVDAGLIIPTGTEPPPKPRPKDFNLRQNYPNPFNPSTTISYYLPVGGTASIKVFSMIGKEIATLVREDQSAGNHVVAFAGSGLPSGVYLYELRLGGFSQTKKLVLLR